MDLIFVYILALYGTLAAAALYLFLCYAYRWIEPKLLFYAALAHHTYIFRNHAWARLTCIQVCILLAYLAANGVAIGLGIQDTVGLETRSATVALLNLVLVSFAGHAHQIAETAGLSLSMYRFLHFWAGRVTVVEALLHVALVVTRRQTIDDLFKSGCIVRYRAGFIRATANNTGCRELFGHLALLSLVPSPVKSAFRQVALHLLHFYDDRAALACGSFQTYCIEHNHWCILRYVVNDAARTTDVCHRTTLQGRSRQDYRYCLDGRSCDASTAHWSAYSRISWLLLLHLLPRTTTFTQPPPRISYDANTQC